MTSSQADHNLAVLAEAAFHRLARSRGQVFVDRGARGGGRVGVRMGKWPEGGIAYSAIWRAGGVVTPVVFLVSPPELRHILADSGAVTVVTTAELLATVAAAAAGAPRLRHVIVVG